MRYNNYVRTKAQNDRLLSFMETSGIVSAIELTKIKAEYAYAQKQLMDNDNLLGFVEEDFRRQLLKMAFKNLKAGKFIQRLKTYFLIQSLLLKGVSHV
ncbi:MAG: hypothetical protein LEGION0398_MBIBDBAK_00206 [Legionellaceae bacterium]